MSLSLRKAHDPLVLAIDIGSTASRSQLFDATGTPLRGTRQRVPHAFTTAPDGTSVIDPDQVLRDISSMIDGVLASAKSGGPVAGVAMDTFASSVVGVDDKGAPLTPCYTYADARPAAQVAQLRQEQDEAAIQQRTGTRFGSGYLPARLRWFRAEQKDVADRVHRWLSLGEYVYAHLLGQYAASYSTAAWTGLLDRAAGTWDAELIQASGGRVEQFSPLHDTSEPLKGAGTPAAKRWPALARARWFPAVTDGYASNVGSGATDSTTIALSAATSGALRVLVEQVPETVPSGLWCYRVSKRRSLLGGALNDVGRVATWLQERLRLPRVGALDAPLRAPPIAGTPAVLPFLTGERSPGWAASARAAFADVTAATDALGLWRGAMEGVALRYALIAQQLATVAPQADRIIASGGVAETWPGWLQVVADALGRPVTGLAERRSTLHGTALVALEVLAPKVERATVKLGETFSPIAEHAPYYRDALAQQQKLYARLVGDEMGRE
ncbi:MAG: gluconokinase [Dehalococcoidia bacterium]